MKTFIPVNPRINFPEQEKEVHAFWEKHEIFQRSLNEREEGEQFTFFDGPPFATGLPHYGHLLQSTLKDVIPRYKTMCGYRVERRWGWDCHGLPVEHLLETELGIKSKQEIESMGVAHFNESCRSSVLRCAADWEHYVTRIGRWVDFHQDYKTMDVSYMESVWWVFAKLWEAGLIYEGKKSMHLCPRCATPLSNFEVTLGYKDTTDTSVIATFPVVGQDNTFLLAWTTTPWTLPANLLLAVNPEVVYQMVEIGSKYRYIVAKDLVPTVMQHEYTVVDEFPGSTMVEMAYMPPFPIDFSAGAKGVTGKEATGTPYRVVAADFVQVGGEKAGTGIVHIAPAFGEDDLNVGQREDVPFFQHIALDGTVTADFPDFHGKTVWELNAAIVEALRADGRLFHHEEYSHSAPFCWRCSTKLINYATSSWFVAVTELKEKLMAHNDGIHWVPGHIRKGRFGEWLAGARDWAISRNRYWGAPLPVWKCDASGYIEVISSQKELEEKVGKPVPDLHKHFVDNLTWTSPHGGVMRRIPEVLDCWFESGAMPYGSSHYPFEGKEAFEKHFPADFIGEGLDQTRGWFYTLHILAVALFDRPAYRNVVCTGLILAEDGQKMSKSKKNYPDPLAVLDKFGADAMRFYMLNSPVVEGEELCFSEKRLGDFFRNFVLMLWNSYSFFVTYASLHDVSLADLQGELENGAISPSLLDRWMYSRLEGTRAAIARLMDDYEIYSATRQYQPLLTDISKWYIRRSRDRLQAGDPDALRTLYVVLLTFAKLLAPFMPFLAEVLYQNLVQMHFDPSVAAEGQPVSIHLCRFPEAQEGRYEPPIEVLMELVRAVAEAGNRARRDAGIKVRQPLASITVFLAASEWEKLDADEQVAVDELLCDELNVKAVFWEKAKTDTEEVVAVELDTVLTDELRREGMVRELARTIQSRRQKLGLDREDTVMVTIEATKALQDFIHPSIGDVQEQTGSKTVRWDADAIPAAVVEQEGQQVETVKLGQEEVRVWVEVCC